MNNVNFLLSYNLKHSLKSGLVFMMATLAGMMAMLAFAQPAPVQAATLVADNHETETETQQPAEGSDSSPIITDENSATANPICRGVNLEGFNDGSCDTKEATETLNQTIERFITLFSCDSRYYGSYYVDLRSFPLCYFTGFRKRCQNSQEHYSLLNHWSSDCRFGSNHS